MKARQGFSFLKTKPKLLNKEYRGFYGVVNFGFRLGDGSIIVVLFEDSGDSFSGFVDQDGSIYEGTIFKFSSTGQFDKIFYNNLQTKILFSSRCIATDGNNLYIGGGNIFPGRITKMSTSGIFDTTFNNALDLKFNSAIHSIVVNVVSNSLYIGGKFTSFNNIANNARYIAKISTSGVFDTAFSNNLDVVSGIKDGSSGFNDYVSTIVTDGSSLYIGGNFTSFKGISNNARKIAKLSMSGVFDTAFSDNLDVTPGTKTFGSGFFGGGESVEKLVIGGGALYVAGSFNSFKNVNNNARGVAKLSTLGVFDTAFSDNLDIIPGTKATTSGFSGSSSGGVGAVALLLDGSSLYVGGDFSSFKNVTNNARKIAKLSTSGVFDTAFSDNLDIIPGTKDITSGFSYTNYYSPVSSIITDGASLFVFGNRIAAFKNISATGFKKISKSGISETFITDVSGFERDSSTTKAVIDNDGNRYIGAFNYYNGELIRGLIKILPNGERDVTFSNNLGQTLNNNPRDILLLNNSLYVCGANSKGIAKVSTSGVLDSTFNSNLGQGFTIGSSVEEIVTDGTHLYVVGSFTSFNGIANNARGIAKISTSGVFDTAFSDNLDIIPGTKASTSGFDTIVRALSISGSSLYVVGSFTSFKGIANNARHIAKLSTSGVFDTAFSDNLDVVPGTKATTSGFDTLSFALLTIVTDGSNLYVGGNMTSFKNIPNNARGIAKLSTSGVFDTAFSDNLDIIPGTKDITSGFGIGTYGGVSQFELVNNILFINSGAYFKNTNVSLPLKMSTSGVVDQNFDTYLERIPGSGTKLKSGGSGNMTYSLQYRCLILVGGLRFKGEPTGGLYALYIDL
jgi:uncharacterized membrane protein